MSLYLVTGGTGYIGSYVAKYIREQGHDVRIVSTRTNDVPGRTTSEMEVVQADIRDFDAMSRAMVGVTGVFHLAARPRIGDSIGNAIPVHDVNVLGTLTVLEAARIAGVKRVVFSSSWSVYGESTALPTPEDAPLQPLSPYSFSKVLGEQAMKHYAELYGLETVSLRYFNAYGPGMREKGSYPTAVSAYTALRRASKPLIIHGTGEQSRDFVHVNDIARANWLAMQASTVGKGEAINIGSGTDVSIKDIAERLKGEEGIIYEPRRQADAMRALADITKAKTLLDWEPEISLEEGLAEVLRVEGLV